MFIYFLVVVTCVSAWICYQLAKKKGLKRSYWTMLGALIGPFAIPFVLFAREKAPPSDGRHTGQD